ncbi:formate dehydrogenase accessory sulfurtransferase FdhD [Paracoccus denitrificans]|uniref:formate dehydrogenase accessory sulfurtransferase FdhD n=1 Tax=Paracoccus denitrificans TaxID=266 RepID=UPI001E64C3C1|nr:formate dehydrogenase accessory sulfurtransferase FdhD [Paracoccus denitrificans]UFS67037.1 formate dehydrogenase accessory sulfurtransferase FdhD [Paracoccus denitrificans]
MRDVKAGVLRWDGGGDGRPGGWHPVEPPPAPQECPVAIVIDGMSQAVLMATPHDLRDFALGFALTEGLIATPGDVEGFEEAEVSAGGFPAREARLWLRPGLAARLAERRRSMIGPVGCGLCGVDSIEAALPQIVPVASGWSMPPGDVARAMAALTQGQVLRRETPAIHGAAFWDGDHAITREDVGRHNALDKLAGALAQAGLAAGQGAIVMSSRLSVDLVQKAARIGAPILIGASAPTALALEWAERAGITVIARARGDGFDLYTHPRRIAGS